MQIFQVALVVKNHLPMQETEETVFDTEETVFDPSVGKIPWRRSWQPSPVFLP